MAVAEPHGGPGAQQSLLAAAAAGRAAAKQTGMAASGQRGWQQRAAWWLSRTAEVPVGTTCVQLGGRLLRRLGWEHGAAGFPGSGRRWRRSGGAQNSSSRCSAASAAVRATLWITCACVCGLSAPVWQPVFEIVSVCETSAPACASRGRGPDGSSRSQLSEALAANIS